MNGQSGYIQRDKRDLFFSWKGASSIILFDRGERREEREGTVEEVEEERVEEKVRERPGYWKRRGEGDKWWREEKRKKEFDMKE